jgi:hypothetical protein
MIGLTQTTVSTNAAAGAVVGTLSLRDAAGAWQAANFILDENAAGFFTISGSNIVIVNHGIAPAFYSVKVTAVATKVTLTSEATFTLTVTAT